MSLPIDLTVGTLPYALVVLVMLAVEVVLLLLLIPRERESATLAFGVLVASALLGSAGALLAVFWAILYPNLNSLTIVFEALGISMGFPPGLWMIAIIAFHDDRIEPRSQPWPLVLATVATLGEVLMGLIFVAAAGPVSGAASVAAATLVSPWYLWSSASAMVALLLWIPLDRGRRALLLSLTLSGVVAPWVRTDPTVGAALMASAMALTFGILYWFVLRTPSPSPEIGPVVRWVSIAYVATAAAGFGSAVTGGSDAALIGFGLVMTAVMVGELRYLLTEGLGRGPPALGPVDAALSASRASPAP